MASTLTSNELLTLSVLPNSNSQTLAKKVIFKGRTRAPYFHTGLSMNYGGDSTTWVTEINMSNGNDMSHIEMNSGGSFVNGRFCCLVPGYYVAYIIVQTANNAANMEIQAYQTVYSLSTTIPLDSGFEMWMTTDAESGRRVGCQQTMTYMYSGDILFFSTDIDMTNTILGVTMFGFLVRELNELPFPQTVAFNRDTLTMYPDNNSITFRGYTTASHSFAINQTYGNTDSWVTDKYIENGIDRSFAASGPGSFYRGVFTASISGYYVIECSVRLADGSSSAPVEVYTIRSGIRSAYDAPLEVWTGVDGSATVRRIAIRQTCVLLNTGDSILFSTDNNVSPTIQSVVIHGFLYCTLPNLDWSPMQINKELWLDATDSRTITLSNSRISQWNDKSGCGRNATQSTAGSRPVMTTETYNKNKIIDFSSGTFFNIAKGLDSLVFAEYCVFACVVRKQPGNNTIIGGSSSTSNSSLNLGWVGVNTLSLGHTGNELNVSVELYSSPIVDVVCFINSYSNGKQIYKNGTLLGSSSDTNVLVAFPGVTIGKSNSSGSTFTGAMAEILVLNYVPSTIVRQLIEGYMIWKISKSGSTLPSDHPFKSRQPLVNDHNINYDAWTPTINAVNNPNSRLRLWYDASDASYLGLISTAVDTIRDKSGYGRHLTQPNSNTSFRPARVASAYNGKATIRFDASNDFMLFDGSFLVGTNWSIFVAVARNSTFQRYWLTSSNIASPKLDNGGLLLGWSSNTTHSIDQYNNVLSATVSGFSARTLELYSYHHSSTTGKQIFRNGTSIAQDSSNTAGLVANPGAQITTAAFNGDICEILIYNDVPSVSNRRLIETWMANKWGLSSSLPTDHPGYIRAIPVTGFTHRYSAKNINGNSTDAYNNNDQVTTWVNTGSTGSRNATQSTVSNRPLYQTNIFGNSPGVYFDGIDDSLIIAADLSLNTYTIAIIFRPQNPANDGCLLGSRLNNSGSFQTFRYEGPNSFIKSHNGSSAYSVITSTSSNIIGIMRRATASSALSIRVNGVNLSVIGALSGTSQSFGQIGCFGGLGGNGARSALFNGWIGEILIYPTVASDTNCLAIESYFAEQWR